MGQGVANVATVLKSLFLLIEAVRHTYDLLHQHIPLFLASKVRFCPDTRSYDDEFQFWTALGVEGDDADQLADMRVEWRDGFLFVSGRCANTPGLLDRLAALAISIFQFR